MFNKEGLQKCKNIFKEMVEMKYLYITFEEQEGFQKLVALAESALNVEGWPEKRDSRLRKISEFELKKEDGAYNSALSACRLVYARDMARKDEEIAELKKSLEIRFGCWLCPKCHTAAPSGHLCTRCLESELSALKSQGKMTVEEISRIIYSIIHKSGPDGDVVGEIAQAIHDRLGGRK
jgi:hypothetical protein